MVRLRRWWRRLKRRVRIDTLRCWRVPVFLPRRVWLFHPVLRHMTVSNVFPHVWVKYDLKYEVPRNLLGRRYITRLIGTNKWRYSLNFPNEIITW